MADLEHGEYRKRVLVALQKSLDQEVTLILKGGAVISGKVGETDYDNVIVLTWGAYRGRFERAEIHYDDVMFVTRNLKEG